MNGLIDDLRELWSGEMERLLAYYLERVEELEGDLSVARIDLAKLNSALLAERLRNAGKVHPCDDSTAAALASELADNASLRAERDALRADAASLRRLVRNYITDHDAGCAVFVHPSNYCDCGYDDACAATDAEREPQP